MILEQAERIAGQVKVKLAPYCERIEIAGSIRRRRPWVNDIDIVAIPKSHGQFAYQLQQLGPISMGGQKIIRVKRPDIDLDVYVATPESWATLLLIRTGSKRHNVALCLKAKSMGMKLHANGSGLFRLTDREMCPEERVAGDTEASIFEALGLGYRRPEERE